MKPLAGRTVLVTRPADQSVELVRRLRRLGAAAIVAPTIEIAPVRSAALTAALRDLSAGRFAWITLTSRSTVEMLASRLDAPSDVRAKVAAIGDGTAQGVPRVGAPDARPHAHDVHDHRVGSRVPSWRGTRALRAADIAPAGMEDALAAKGWSPVRVDAYRTRMARTLPAEARAALRDGRVDAITFTSASTVRGFVGAMGVVRGNPKVVSIGPVTAKEAREHGLRVSAVARPHTIEGWSRPSNGSSAPKPAPKGERFISARPPLLALRPRTPDRVARPKGLPQAVVAVPAAALLLVLGALPCTAGEAKASPRPSVPRASRPTAIDAARRAGRCRVARRRASDSCSPCERVTAVQPDRRWLRPVVFATVARLRLRAKPHVYACTHLANSASLLLPVSNLTNLLAFQAADFRSPVRRPWRAMGQAAQRSSRGSSPQISWHGDSRRGPTAFRSPLAVVPTLAGFFVTSILGIDPAFAALAGAVALGVPASEPPGRRGHQPRSTSVPCSCCPGLVSRPSRSTGWDRRRHPPRRHVARSLLYRLSPRLPTWSTTSAVHLLLPVAAATGPGPVLAVLVGVNTGPNLTYARLARHPPLAAHPPQRGGALHRQFPRSPSPPPCCCTTMHSESRATETAHARRRGLVEGTWQGASTAARHIPPERGRPPHVTPSEPPQRRRRLSRPLRAAPRANLPQGGRRTSRRSCRRRAKKKK